MLFFSEPKARQTLQGIDCRLLLGFSQNVYIFHPVIEALALVLGADGNPWAFHGRGDDLVS